jgi:hypothetical protein
MPGIVWTGGTRRSRYGGFKISHTVDAETRTPRPASSPWILRAARRPAAAPPVQPAHRCAAPAARQRHPRRSARRPRPSAGRPRAPRPQHELGAGAQQLGQDDRTLGRRQGIKPGRLLSGSSPDPAPSPWSLSPISATAAEQPASPGRPGVLFNAARFPEGRPSCSAWREASPEDCPGALEAVSGLRYHPGSPATSDHPIPTSRSSCRSAHRCSAERYSAAFSTSTTERRERLRKPAGQTRRRILKRYTGSGPCCATSGRPA